VLSGPSHPRPQSTLVVLFEEASEVMYGVGVFDMGRHTGLSRSYYIRNRGPAFGRPWPAWSQVRSTIHANTNEANEIPHVPEFYGVARELSIYVIANRAEKARGNEANKSI